MSISHPGEGAVYACGGRSAASPRTRSGRSARTWPSTGAWTRTPPRRPSPRRWLRPRSRSSASWASSTSTTF